MKEIKGFPDIIHIINIRCDVYDFQGHKIPFVRFVSMPLAEIINIFNQGWTYEN